MAAFKFSAVGFPSEPGRDTGMGRFLAVSVILHLVVLTAAATATLFRGRPPAYRPAYTVDLVSLPLAPRMVPAVPSGQHAPDAVPAPGPKPAPKAGAKPSSAKTPPAAPPATARKAEAPVKAKAAIPVRDGEGDEEAQKRTDRKKKIAELEKEAQKLYESIHKAGEPSPPPAATTGGTGTGAPRAGAAAASLQQGAAAGLAGPISAGTGAVDFRVMAYYDRIWEEIKASWVLPSDVSTTDRQLVAVLGIRIAPNGSIEHHWIEKSSGNIYYDQSAIRAISKADPLPPPPREVGGGSLEVGINFRVTE